MPHKLTVLHPSDFSEQSALAFAHALRIAVAGDSRVRLLHVCKSDASIEWGDFPTAAQALHRWGWLDAPEDEQALRDLGFEAEELVIKGDNTIATMLNYIEKNPADIIVLATRGREGLERWWHGSIAEPIARVSNTMTLFVADGVNGFVDPQTGDVSLKSILLPVVAKPNPTYALAAARSIAEAVGAENLRLTMVYVGDAADTPMIHDDAAELFTREGDVVEELLKAADEVAADLIVMTTEGHNGILDAFRGSTTEQVLRGAKCPVLAIPAIED